MDIRPCPFCDHPPESAQHDPSPGIWCENPECILQPALTEPRMKWHEVVRLWNGPRRPAGLPPGSTSIDHRLDRIERGLDRISTLLGEKKTYISKADAARRLGISPQTFQRRFIDSGKLLLRHGKLRRTEVEALY